MKRRDLLKTSLVSSISLLALSKTAMAANICAPGLTPKQAEGPFYPEVDQLDTDADLVQVAGQTQAALGEVVLVEGIVTDQFCTPVAGALVEIWQACVSGKYNHASDPNTAPLDPNFQYWGKSVTDKNGFYRFRTIIPGAYPADTDWVRPPHIHFKISRLGYVELITQMYFKGNDLNGQDKILQQLGKSDQEKVVIQLNTVAGQLYPVGEFNIQIKKV